MLMTIRDQNGRRVDAVLLAADRDRIRVAVESARDAVELHRVQTCWFTDDGDEIEIEALIPLEGTGVSGFCAQLCPWTTAASISAPA